MIETNTDTRTRNANLRAHQERGKALGELWNWLRGRN